METKYIPDEGVRTFSDLDLNFIAHPVTGDVVKLKDVEAIKASLKHLVFLNYYEKPFHPDIGTGIYGSLFDLHPDNMAISILKRKMLSILSIYEPRAETLGVEISRPDSSPNSLHVSVYFTPINSVSPVKLDFFLNPVR